MEQILKTLSKHSITITIDLSVILLLLMVGFVGLILCGILYYIKEALIPEKDDEYELVKEEEESDKQNTTRNNHSHPEIKPLEAAPQPELKSAMKKHDPHSSSPRSRISGASVDSSMNTGYDLDEFLTRLFKTFFVVLRIKNNGKDIKRRIMKLNPNGDLIFYKKFQEKSFTNSKLPSNNNNNSNNSINDSSAINTIIPIGNPYMKFPLHELQHCVICEEEMNSTSHSFLLEWKEKLLRLQSPLPIDNTYLIKGFQNLISRLKLDKNYLETWKMRLEQKKAAQLAGNNSNNNSNNNLNNHDDDEDNHTVNEGKSIPGSPSTIATLQTANTTATSKKPTVITNVKPSAIDSKKSDSSDHQLDYGKIYSSEAQKETFVEDVDARLTRKRLSRHSGEEEKKQEDGPQGSSLGRQINL